MAYFPTLKETCLSKITNAEIRDTFVKQYSEMSSDLMSELILHNRYASWTALKEDWKALSKYVIKNPCYLSHFEITGSELLALSKKNVDLSYIQAVFLEKYDEDIVALIPENTSVKLVAKNFELEQIRFIPHLKCIDFSECHWLKAKMFQSLSRVAEIYIYPSFLCEALFTADFFKDLSGLRIFLELETPEIDEQENESRIYDLDSLLKLVYNPVLKAFNLNYFHFFWKSGDMKALQSDFIQKLDRPLDHISVLSMKASELEDETLDYLISKFRCLKSLIINKAPYFTIDRIGALCKANPKLYQFGLGAEGMILDNDFFDQLLLQKNNIKDLFLKGANISLLGGCLDSSLKTIQPISVALMSNCVNSYTYLLSYLTDRMIQLFDISWQDLSTDQVSLLLSQANIHALNLSNIKFTKSRYFTGFTQLAVSEISITDPIGLDNQALQSLIVLNPSKLHLKLTEDGNLDYYFIDNFYNSELSLASETTLILEVPISFWGDDAKMEKRMAFYGSHCLERNLNIVIKGKG